MAAGCILPCEEDAHFVCSSFYCGACAAGMSCYVITGTKENRGESGLNASLRVSFGLLPRVDVGRTIRRDFNSEQ
ncbi:hypothetical protein ALC60_01823 [Trachymyrmex zeteki]|uniref:Uncharacterized protein n=1 Tax=Mycetomoellerius zeteki TaxID=64791 RepID=A0A151XFV7_9HYME|nr:hypothetical protein ALC60_01823 [Trachymyrmex zeteki]